jgi:hypothetical protein
MVYTTLSYQDKVLKMSFDKILEAYKEAILSSVNKRDYDQADILNTSMNLLSESVKTKPVVKAIPVTKFDTIDQPAVSAVETEEFVINLVSLQGRIHSTKALDLFYLKYKNRFTDYDFALNQKGEPRWKNRFWSVTSNMRKSNILMPNEGRFVNVYVLREQNQVAEN